MRKNNTLNMNYYNVEDATGIFDTIISQNDIQVCGKNHKFIDISAAFDIETTSFYDDGKNAIMYVWQFGVTNDKTGETYVIMGRTWTEFMKLYNIINTKFNFGPDIYFPIYIHKLNFELNFLRPILNDRIKQVFSLNSNKPIYMRSDNIEFRCSYLLSGLRLEELPTKKYKKAVGDLDYSLVRHSNTELTDKEISYCMLDVLVLCEYISSKRKTDGDISKVLYTKTSYVRHELQKICRSNKEYKKSIASLKFHSYREFFILNRAFVGGYASISGWHINKTIKNIKEYDISSFYPSIIVSSDKFPISFKEYNDSMDKTTYEFFITHGYAIVCLATFTNIKSRDIENYIQTSQIIVENNQVDVVSKHGRLVSCSGKCSIFLTNPEYESINWFYSFDNVEFNFCYVYKTGYLPKEVVGYTLNLYQKKTELKDTEFISEYTNSKEQLNSIFGSSVMNPCKREANINIEDGHWDFNELSIQEKYDRIDKYNKDIFYGKVSMPYIWGVYIAALARNRLAACIYNTTNFGCWVYSDTDSLYLEMCDHTDKFIETFNNYINDIMIKAMRYHGFKEDAWIGTTISGTKKQLGFFEYKGTCERFKCLGIKRYLKLENNELKVVLSGLNSDKSSEYLLSKYKDIDKVFDNFEEGLKIPAEYTGRYTSTIITRIKSGKITDYNGIEFNYTSLGGIHLEKSSYEFSPYMERINWLFGVITETSR